MEILSSPAGRVDAPVPLGQQNAADLLRLQRQVSRLRAQVANLQAERTALWWAAGHDELTGLPNRRLFNTVAPRLLAQDQPAAVLILDLNGFKPINDTFGHDVGDQVLRIVAQRLLSCCAARQANDFAARLAGDEFALVITGSGSDTDPHWWQPAVTAIGSTIAEPMLLAGHRLEVRASIGVAPAHDHMPVDELLHRADLAMYHAKTTGISDASWSNSPCVLEITLFPAPLQLTSGEPAPTCDPHERNPAEVAPASTYRPNDPVWVHRNGSWRPGVIDGASARGVMATYSSGTGPGTMVDTMAAKYVLARNTSPAEVAA